MERVRRILALLGEGHSLPAIAARLRQRPAPPERPQGVWNVYLEAALEAIGDFSNERLEALYNEASSLYPVDLVTERLIEPLLVELGTRWRERETGIAEEHFFSAWLRNRLGARFHHALGQCDGPRIVCAGVPGSRHEVGLLLFALSAMARGYRVVYLGPDLPLDQLPLVVDRCAARAVVLGGRDPIDQPLRAALAALAAGMPVPVMLGGPCSDAPLAEFEAAGGIRLGARIPVALRLLRARVRAEAVRRRGR
ncbi:MAG: hypothetical protein D6786_04255 [Gammaproteobacteria bacterium]|nr:MAG: hypothetical protein D6786_04255 [Gammaproteobacteria bacterium]